MKLYNSNTEKIENVNTILVDNINKFADKMSEPERVAQGYYDIVKPDVTAGKKLGATGTIVNDKYVIDLIDKTLDELKAEKLEELNTNYQSALTFTHTFADNTVLTLTLTDTVQTELNKRGVSLSVNTDENKTFVYYDNNYQKITRNASDSNEYLEAVADYLEDLREKRTDKTIAINVAQDKTELNNVDITF